MSSSANSASSPAGWFENLARAKAQIAAGQTVQLLPVLERLRASAERLEAASNQSLDEAGKSADE